MMKITVINGTEKHGITFRLKEFFLEEFKGRAEITEFFLPKDCPNFCRGCTNCVLRGPQHCKDVELIQKIDKALRDADLLVFTTPAYVFHATGAMKNLLDHFAYRWMPHRPAKEMFGKRAVIITQCLGAGNKSAAKDIKDSLAWWGISSITICRFKLMSDTVWENIPEKKREKMEDKLKQTAQKLRQENYEKPTSTSLVVKLKFHAVRKLQTSLGKKNPEYADYKYWKEQGWIEKVRPWK